MQNFSKAHQVLRINELLNFIAADLPSKDQVQMALTCRAIYEPIMDRRWAHISSVACLIRCLPEDALEETDDEGVVQLNICEILEPRQWERFQHYARRVKTVVQMKDDLHHCVWSTLEDEYPGEHIFPNLRQLFTQCQDALVYLGKAPMLEVISFNMRPATYPAQSEFPALSPKGFSESEMLSCILSNSRLPPGLGLDAVIFSCRHLTELDIPSLLQSKTLVHLSKLPSLTHLGFDLGEENYDSLSSAPDTTVFRHLKSLQIHAQDSSQLIDWLSSVALPSLTTLRIFTSKQSTEKLSNAVAKFERLTVLQILFLRSTPLLDTSITTLRPLLQRLHLIEELSLFRLPFCISQSSVTAMASAWPKLHRLELTRDPKVVLPTPRITYDVSAFQQHCPNIESVSLQFSDERVPVHMF